MSIEQEIAAHLRREDEAIDRAAEACGPGCEGTDCHCQTCGEVGIELNADGYCEPCVISGHSEGCWK